MSQMLERAAEAIIAVQSDAFHEDRTATPEDIARAVLMAVREPDVPEVLSGMRAAERLRSGTVVETKIMFTAMIDHILSDGGVASAEGTCDHKGCDKDSVELFLNGQNRGLEFCELHCRA